MILVLAGTQDGRELACYLSRRGYAVMASVVSEYGKKLLTETCVAVNDRALTEAELISFIKEHDITMILDATHPYAVNISTTAMKIAERLHLPYIRYERQTSPLPDYEKLFVVGGYEDAAKKAAELGQTVFLTTGSRNLKAFTTAKALADHEIVARVLPEPSVLQECAELGLLPKQIIAMQGPFSETLNKALYEQYRADVVVTKNSGTVGGTDTKITAAMALDLPLVVIDRPMMRYPLKAVSFEEIIQLLGKIGA